MAAPIPANEPERIAALRSYAVLDTGPERDFDRITALAARVLKVPIVLVSLVDTERQWFKSCIGLDTRQTGRDVAFCAHAILSDVPMVVPDALEDARFSDNPLVVGAPFIRFYAGAPLKSSDGQNIGTFCVIDTKPRALVDDDAALLAELAAVVMNELELRRTTRRLQEQATELDRALREAETNRRLFERIAQTSPDAIYMLDLKTLRTRYLNRDSSDRLGLTEEEIAALGDAFIATVVHPDDLERVTNHFGVFDGLTDDRSVELTYRIKHAKEEGYRWFLAHEKVFSRDEQGRPAEILGVATDITELKRAEEKLSHLATTDDLTGAPNRRAFRQRLEQLVAEGERNRRFALAMVDIDHFKRVNDVHGHQVGDQALTAVARTLSRQVRVVDHVARYGGEEFAVLFVDADEPTAVRLAERLRAAVGDIRDPLPLTASFGVAAYAPRMGADGLVKAADEALYEAKNSGRDRVASASRPPRA